MAENAGRVILSHGGKRETYDQFIAKFNAETPKTTDECHTPREVYECVVAWVFERYGLPDATPIVRPFYPGGDYQSEPYPAGCVVIDNPPFSILSKIVRWYCEHGVRFFLFAPSLTLFSSSSSSSCAIPCHLAITYDNGARVNTSFLTNLEAMRFHTYPDLIERLTVVEKQRAAERKQEKRSLPKYVYPPEVVTAAMLGTWAKNGVEFAADYCETARVVRLDEQREYGKAIFGSGFLLSEDKVREAERAVREAKRAAAKHWTLSERERGIVASLGRKDHHGMG